MNAEEIEKVDRTALAAKFDKAWDIVKQDPDLAFARQRLSFHELRHIIRAVAQAFSTGA